MGVRLECQGVLVFLPARRRTMEAPKGEKDIFQAAVLAAALAREQDFSLQEAIDTMNRPLRCRVKPGAWRALTMLESDHPEAAQVLQKLA